MFGDESLSGKKRPVLYLPRHLRYILTHILLYKQGLMFYSGLYISHVDPRHYSRLPYPYYDIILFVAIFLLRFTEIFFRLKVTVFLHSRCILLRLVISLFFLFSFLFFLSRLFYFSIISLLYLFVSFFPYFRLSYPFSLFIIYSSAFFYFSSF